MVQQVHNRTPSFWNSRYFEWGVVIVVLFSIVGVFARQYRQLEGQAEYAAIQSTMGNMRTALLLDFLQRSASARAQAAPGSEQNPFPLLMTPIENYAGEVPMAEQADVEPGSWVFDGKCVCVGYRPLHPEWLLPAKDPAVLWFKLSSNGGPIQMTALHHYRWQGQTIY